MAQSKKSSPCPICKKPGIQELRPFCSERCKMIDLGHWLKGTYVVPGNDGSAQTDLRKDKEEDIDDPDFHNPN